MKRILVGSFLEVHSNGDAALLTGMTRALREATPDTHLTLLISDPDITRARYGQFLRANGVEIARTPWFRGGSSTRRTLMQSGLLALQFALCRRGMLKQYDLYLELGTDTHTDYYGTVPFYSCLYPLLLCIATRTPMAICAQSVGPFKSGLSKRVARFVFGKASLITLRDEISEGYLRELGIDEARLVADPAFLLEPASRERVDEILADEGVTSHPGPFIGIAASQRIHTYAFGSGYKEVERKAKYIEMMARLVDHIVERMGISVLLVSHDNTPRKSDWSISEEIFQNTKAKEKVILLKGNYATDEIKGVIGRCEMFIGCRMHAAIAATSMHVPTIAVAYGHKFQGVFAGILDPEKDIIDIAQCSPEGFLGDMTSRVQTMWEKRTQTARELAEIMPGVRSRALLNARLVADLVGNNTNTRSAVSA